MFWNQRNNQDTTAVDTAATKPFYLTGLFLPVTSYNLLPTYTPKVTPSPEPLIGNKALATPGLQLLEGFSTGISKAH